ncbi:uncharacterized protein LOC126567086 [Anopheles maculipalpis]|uniref:uncharacterized protein LOC126567086 n=1 Tax=Anopheles maculipalpis TaxID=1496333 RepID=UPI002158CF8C|nr:uncharacterized protein LOC126567086 [Anopheles maculipalpis]
MQTLIDYGVSVEELCATIKARRMEEQNHNSSLMKELVDRLPPCLKLMWGIHKESKLISSSLQEYGTWMRTITNAAVSVTPPPQQSTKRSDTKYVNTHTEPRTNRPPTRDDFSCLICQKEECRSGPDCDKLLSSSTNERWGYVRRYRLCRRCLWKHPGRCHIASPCNKNGCSMFHHELLHGETIARDSMTTFAHNCTSEKSLLKYVPVTLYGNGKNVNTFALLDDGSSVTLMDHALLDELNLKGTLSPICLSWTGNQTREETRSHTVAVCISGDDKDGKRYTMSKVHTISKLALPTQSLPLPELAEKYDHLQKSNARSYHEVAPRILIGVDNFFLTRPLKTIEGAAGEPIATKTRLGWVVCGPHDQLTTQKDAESRGVHLCTCTKSDEDIDAVLREIFSSEKHETCHANSVLSKDHERAYALLDAHTKFVDGRFETGLLWRSDNVSLPDSRRMALRRLECLEKRLRRDKNLAAVINQKLEEFLKKGKWYLPIFPVINPNKPGKVRLVWDAAAAVKGTSLNTSLLSGPDLLTPLPSVLYRFREYRFAVAADIREMYHQVVIRKEDEHSQRFLWRWGDAEQEPEEFVMTRMTFGATCSPASAQYVKNVNADRFIEKLPQAVRCVKEQHYVDDLLVSTECEDDAVQLATEIQYIHSQGGFQLHNWLSNSNKVAEKFSGNVVQQRHFHSDPVTCVQKVLGMWWNQQTDTFSFKMHPKRDNDILDGETIPTKRQILRVLMSMQSYKKFGGQELLGTKKFLKICGRNGKYG